MLRDVFLDICVMVIGTNGKGRMLCCLLDIGYSKSIVLQKFTDKKQRLKLHKEDTVHYTTCQHYIRRKIRVN